MDRKIIITAEIKLVLTVSDLEDVDEIMSEIGIASDNDSITVEDVEIQNAQIVDSR